MRLTKTYADGSFGVADDLPCGENSHEFKRLLINKLGAYEELESRNAFKVTEQPNEMTAEEDVYGNDCPNGQCS